MRYWGKLLGLILGIMSGGGVWGVITGVLMGHMVDRARAARRRDYFSAQSTRQSLFFLTTFQAMGHLTKSKGRVWQRSRPFVKGNQMRSRYAPNCVSCAMPAWAASI